MLTEDEKIKRKDANLERMKKRRNKAMLILGAFLFLILFGKCIWGPIGVNLHYSDGERKVQIIKVSLQGMVWKTWEAEGILAPGHGIATTYVWHFSIDDEDPKKDDLLQKLTTAYENGTTVRVLYDQRMGNVPWRSSTEYFVKDILPAK